MQLYLADVSIWIPIGVLKNIGPTNSREVFKASILLTRGHDSQVYEMSVVASNLVFGVFDKERLKSAFSATY